MSIRKDPNIVESYPIYNEDDSVKVLGMIIPSEKPEQIVIKKTTTVSEMSKQQQTILQKALLVTNSYRKQ